MDERRAKITDAVQDDDGTWLYSWQEQEANYTTGADQLPVAFASGTADLNPAVEINNTEVPVGTVAHLRPRGFVNGQLWFEFAHEESSAVETGALGYVATGPIFPSLTWVASGFMLDLPSAGTYFVFGAICAVSLPAFGYAGGLAMIAARLFNNTAGVPIDLSLGICISQSDPPATYSGLALHGQCAVGVVVTVTGPTVLEIQGYRTDITPGWSISSISTDVVDSGDHGTRLGYMKVG